MTFEEFHAARELGSKRSAIERENEKLRNENKKLRKILSEVVAEWSELYKPWEHSVFQSLYDEAKALIEEE